MVATLAAWVHQLDPILLDGPGAIDIRWYGLSYVAGFAVAWLIIKHVARVSNSPLKPELASEMVVTLAVAIVVGGRLGYVLLYQPALLWQFSDSLPYWGVLAINQGGMASHGGMVGGAIGSVYFARRLKLPWLHIADLFAFGAPLGLFFGRIANFINGELYGRGPTSVPWAVIFPQEVADDPNYPAKLLKLQEAYGQPLPNDPVAAIQQGNEALIQAAQQVLTPRHPSQLYAAVMEGLVVMAVLLIAWRKPRKPGTIGGIFCVAYAIMRIINEFFRNPDAHLLKREFASLGVTRGQWLSVLLLVAGVVIIVVCQRRKVEPLGGWRKVVSDDSETANASQA